MTDQPGGPQTGPEPQDLVRAVEALLVVLDGPLAVSDVARAWRLEPEQVSTALIALQARCEREQRGYALRETASGWRLYASADLERPVRAAVVGETSTRLSAAALETLAVVAYQQPVSKSRVAAVRGVNVDAVVRTLSTRGLVTDVGVDRTSGATLYGTTDLFLDLLGLQSLDALPALAPLLPDIESAASLEA